MDHFLSLAFVKNQIIPARPRYNNQYPHQFPQQHPRRHDSHHANQRHIYAQHNQDYEYARQIQAEEEDYEYVYPPGFEHQYEVEHQPDSPVSRYERLVYEHQLANESVLRRQTTYSALDSERIQLENSLEGFTQKITRTENMKQSVQQDIDESNPVALYENVVNQEYLIQKFQDLGDEIHYLCADIVGTWAHGLDGVRISLSEFSKRCEQDVTWIDKNASYFISMAAKLGVDFTSALTSLLEHRVRKRLMAHIFSPFAPGIDKVENELYNQLYDSIRRKEPQEHAARWRALTYSELLPANAGDWYVGVANKFLGDVFLLLNAVVGGKSSSGNGNGEQLFTQEGLTDIFGQKTVGIFQSAGSWQLMAKTQCLAADFRPFLPTPSVTGSSKFDSSMMTESHGGPGKNGKRPPTRPIIAAGLGLERSVAIPIPSSKPRGGVNGRARNDSSLGMTIEYFMVGKAAMICDNWYPFRRK